MLFRFRSPNIGSLCPALCNANSRIMLWRVQRLRNDERTEFIRGCMSGGAMCENSSHSSRICSIWMHRWRWNASATVSYETWTPSRNSFQTFSNIGRSGLLASVLRAKIPRSAWCLIGSEAYFLCLLCRKCLTGVHISPVLLYNNALVLPGEHKSVCVTNQLSSLYHPPSAAFCFSVYSYVGMSVAIATATDIGQ